MANKIHHSSLTLLENGYVGDTLIRPNINPTGLDTT